MQRAARIRRIAADFEYPRCPVQKSNNDGYPRGT